MGGGGIKVLEGRGEDAMVMEGRGEGVKGLWRGSDRVWVWAGLGLRVALPFLELALAWEGGIVRRSCEGVVREAISMC